MRFVLTLISDPAARNLTEECAQTALMSLTRAGMQAGNLVWLASRIACDIVFDTDTTNSDVSHASLETMIANDLGDAPLDVVIQSNRNRRKQLLVADMDSTVIEQECLDELADFVGLKAKVSDITKRAMAGKIQFEPALKERVSLLKGLDEHVLKEVFTKRITLTPGAAELVGTMRAHGAVTCLVSGGFTFFTQRVAAAAGFELQRGNTLLSDKGKLTGQVGEPILGRAAKLKTLSELQQNHYLSRDQTLVVGDGANDLAMIEAAGMGVAFRANQILMDGADVTIRHGDLTALLYIQGYHADEFTGGP
jgi:phosphoserine phosphatase